MRRGGLIAWLLALTACPSFAPGPDNGDNNVAQKSCKDLHAANLASPSGYYTIDPDGDGPSKPVELYCEMSTSDGGWTLVARSVAGKGNSGFGWKQALGAVRNDDDPYSLDAEKLAPFTEVLFGVRGTGKAWTQDGPVYKRPLPPDFLASFGDRISEPSASLSVDGTCKAINVPGNEPTMLSRVGTTDDKDHFLFTDQPTPSPFGLDPDGWNTNGDQGTPTCAYDGLLTGTQGMIFVR